jgi:predicted nucleic acid-binding protein
MDILVDSNVILDIVTEDKKWFPWSSQALAKYAEPHTLVINPIIFAEVSVGFDRIEDVEEVSPSAFFRRDPIPWEAAFLAARCFFAYRRRGGKKSSTLPDFFIGAHAAVVGIPLLTRDIARYRTYFPKLKIITPGS